MKHYILLHKLKGDPGVADYQQLAERPKVVVLKVVPGVNDLLWILRYAYYAFIVSLPFEAVDIGLDVASFSLSKLIGYVFLMATLLQPHLCFKLPPRAFWLFTIYLCMVVLRGILQESQYYSPIITQLLTQTQLLIFFWIAYNLMRYERIGTGTLWALTVSCLVLAILQALDITSTGNVHEQGRVSAFGINPNSLAWVLSLGLLALVGLAYGREDMSLKVRLLTWLSFGVFAAAIIRTGSRGAIVALVAGFMTFLLKGRSLGTKLKVGLIALLAIGALVWISSHIEAVRVRWERTLFQADTAGRDKIFQVAWEMCQEQPLIGWGPIHHYFELGSRLGHSRPVDPHNLYLWILIETGLLGAVPFFAGLWLCLHASWKARHSILGIAPMAMMLCLLIINTKGTGLKDKLFWVVLAYALASSSSVSRSWKWRRRVHPANTWPMHWPTPATSPFPDYVTPLHNNLNA
jgi:O-antigen ligase